MVSIGLLQRTSVDTANLAAHNLLIFEQEAHHKVALGEMPRRFILKHCRHSSLEKCEHAFDTALDLMQTKPSDAAFLDVFLTLLNADQKQLAMSNPAGL